MEYPESGSRVGFEYVNKVGELVKVVSYRHNKDLTVAFDDGLEVKTTWMYVKEGRPLHPTRRKVQVGQEFPCRDGDTVVVEQYNSTTDIVVKWKSDGATAKTTLETLKRGNNKHPTKNQPLVGTKWKLNNGHTVTVREFNSATNVVVEFEDGNQTTTYTRELQKGTVGHPKSGLFVGQVFTTNSGWIGEVVEYESCYRVKVKWQDGSSSWHPAAHVSNGGIKPKFQPSVCGVGYFGEGRWEAFSKNPETAPPEKIYSFWIRMINRCYNPYELNKEKGASYRDVFVCEDWHNFHNFAEWCFSQKHWNKPDMELDKDLLGNGLLYSPEGCCILHREINKFLMDGVRGRYKRGVHVIEPKHPNAAVGYVARCHFDGDRGYLGFYPTVDMAFSVYKKRKEEVAKILAERHKELLSEYAYQKLVAFAVKEW